jgi:hypothetical protein
VRNGVIVVQRSVDVESMIESPNNGGARQNVTSWVNITGLNNDINWESVSKENLSVNEASR